MSNFIRKLRSLRREFSRTESKMRHRIAPRFRSFLLKHLQRLKGLYAEVKRLLQELHSRMTSRSTAPLTIDSISPQTSEKTTSSRSIDDDDVQTELNALLASQRYSNLVESSVKSVLKQGNLKDVLEIAIPFTYWRYSKEKAISKLDNDFSSIKPDHLDDDNNSMRQFIFEMLENSASHCQNERVCAFFVTTSSSKDRIGVKSSVSACYHNIIIMVILR